MNHPRPAVLERHALGELSADERLAVDAHVAECPSCAKRLAGERALDDVVVRTAGEVLPAGTSRRMFDELWATVDAEDATAAARPPRWGRGLRRAAALVVLAAAAVLVVQLVPSSDESSSEALRESTTPPVAQTEPTVVAPPSEPVSEPEPAVSAEPTSWEARLAAALERPGVTTIPDDETTRRAAAAADLAVTLAAADAEAPRDDAAFVATCAAAIDALRAEGLAVDPLVRRIVSSDDEPAARATVRLARLGVVSDAALARALADDRLADEVLDALVADGLPRPPSARLVRALVARLDARLDDVVAALATLGADAALVDELERRLVAAERRPSTHAVRAVLALGRAAPVDAAVDAWLDLARIGEQADAARREFDVTLERHGDAALAALAAAFDDPRRADVAAEWAERLESPALAPARLSRALSRDDETFSDALAGADARALPTLFDAWRERRDRPLGPALAGAAARLLRDDRDASTLLVDALPPDAVDDLVAFATDEPAARDVAADLLTALALRRPPRDESRRALVLGHLARVGDATHAARLIDALSASGDDALGWLTSASLAPEAAERAFVARGGEPGALSALLNDAGAWPTYAHVPPNRVVRRAARALDRLPTPDHSSRGDD